MRVFLCSFNGFFVAIPMEQVSSLILFSGKTSQTVEYNNENRNTYISLPKLFKRQLSDIRHGIILKNGNDDDGIIEDKTILLTTRVECETEIPDDEIYPVPKALGVMRFSSLFSGLKFASGHEQKAADISLGDLILLLNPENLAQNIQEEVKL